MLNLLVSPNLPIMEVERTGVLTVPIEDAVARCNCPGNCAGIDVNKMPLKHRTLQLHVFQMGSKFISRMAIRGYELVGTLRLHGPFPSYDFNRTLQDVESEALKSGDPNDAAVMAFDRSAFNPYSDYVLVGKFLKQATLVEIGG